MNADRTRHQPIHSPKIALPEIMSQAPNSNKRYRAGIDVGGTFTDIVLVEESTGEIKTIKVPTVPGDPSQGCMNGVDKALELYGIEPDQLSFLVHGTTIATNTIIRRERAPERRW